MSKVGQDIIKGLDEAIAHARGEDVGAHVRTVEVPEEVDLKAIRKRLKMTQEEFARRFGFTVHSVRNWEQGQRRPEGPARVLLTVIDREPEAVQRALAA